MEEAFRRNVACAKCSENLARKNEATTGHRGEGVSMTTSMNITHIYGQWRIKYNPKPIPIRSVDWDYWRDGDEETTSGTASSFADAMQQIHDREDSE